MANPKSTNPTATHFSGIPLKALIGAPLKAATDANGMMARAQTQFLLSTCFEKSPEDDNVLTPIMIQFHLQRKALNTDGTSQTNDSSMLFNIPLMTVIPISSLAVESLNISFEMDVKNSTEYNQENSNDQKMSTTGRFSDYKGAQFTTEMYGALSSSNKKTGESKSSARYEIELKAGQLPLPRGLTAILDIFTQNLAPLPAKSSGADNTPDN
ncbi:MAG: DUF2589 domain-containing protein, partial [Gammaproteobacteria bacterium]